MIRKSGHLVIFHYGEVASADFIMSQPSGWFFVPSNCGICHLARRSRDFGPSLLARDAVTGGLFLLFIPTNPLTLAGPRVRCWTFVKTIFCFDTHGNQVFTDCALFRFFQLTGIRLSSAVRFPVVSLYTGIRPNKLCAYPYLILIFGVLSLEVFHWLFRWASALF